MVSKRERRLGPMGVELVEKRMAPHLLGRQRVSWFGITPAIALALGLVAGDGLAAVAPCHLPEWAWAVYLGSAVLLGRAPPPLPLVAVAALAFLIGFVRASGTYLPTGFPPEHVAAFALPGLYEVEARIHSGNVVAGGKTALIVDVVGVRHRGSWRPAVGRVRVNVYRSERAWPSGVVVRAFLKLRRPRRFGNPGEFSYVAYLARQGIYVTASADSDRDWEVLHPAGALRDSPGRWRLRVAALFEREAAPPGGAILRALVVGDQSAIPAPLREAFSRVGVGHVLSISGLHVALVAGAGYVAARFLLSRSEAILLVWNVPKLAAAISLLPVGLYATIAGDSVATRRSILMLGVVLGGLLSNREAYPLNVLAIAAAVVVLADPGITGDVSFQLSFVAVWALAEAARRFRSWWPPVSDVRGSDPAWFRYYSLRYGRNLVASLWLSLAAAAATAPLTAWHFFQIPLIAPVANLVLVPIFGSLAVLLGLATAFVEPLWVQAATVFARMAGLVVQVGCELLEEIDRFPWAAVRGVGMNGWELCAVLSLLVLLAHARGKLLRAGSVLAIAVFAIGLGWRLGSTPEGRALRLLALSVGQANAVLVEFPDLSRWLVDAGGVAMDGFDIGSRVVAPALWRQGIRKLDAVVLTHPQFDHFGGLPAVVQLFRPAFFYHNGEKGRGIAYGRLETSLKAAQVTPVALYRGSERCVAGVHVSVWHPEERPSSPNPNHGSTVLLLRYAGRAVLLPGDIEAGQEHTLLAAKEWAPVDVLLVPHHGSRTSSTPGFVGTLRPRLALVSVGWQNRFRFPHAEVRQRYAAGGSTLLRTDWDGAIEVVIDAAGTLRWRTTLPPWNTWHVEPMAGPPQARKFIDWTCPQG